eukprot:10640-Heterococcus_DN1.PRE.3
MRARASKQITTKVVDDTLRTEFDCTRKNELRQILQQLLTSAYYTRHFVTAAHYTGAAIIHCVAILLIALRSIAITATAAVTLAVTSVTAEATWLASAPLRISTSTIVELLLRLSAQCSAAGFK